MEIKEFKKSEIKELLREENLLEFNRDIAPQHALKMQNSIQKCGLLRMPVIGDISDFDQRRKYVVIDGQHLLTALVTMPKGSGVNKVNSIIKKYSSKKEVIEDISKLNNTQKTWKDQDYLDAWYKFGRDGEYFSNYAYLYNLYNDVFDMLPIGLLIDIYAKSKDAFKEGELTFSNREFSDKVAQTCSDLKLRFDLSSFTLYGLTQWCFNRASERRDINWDKLRSRLSRACMNGEHIKCKKREDFKDFVKEIYTRV